MTCYNQKSFCIKSSLFFHLSVLPIIFAAKAQEGEEEEEDEEESDIEAGKSYVFQDFLHP